MREQQRGEREPLERERAAGEREKMKKGGLTKAERAPQSATKRAAISVRGPGFGMQHQVIGQEYEQPQQYARQKTAGQPGGPAPVIQPQASNTAFPSVGNGRAAPSLDILSLMGLMRSGTLVLYADSFSLPLIHGTS
jgi:hypothetical protein